MLARLEQDCTLQLARCLFNLSRPPVQIFSFQTATNIHSTFVKLSYKFKDLKSIHSS